MKQRVDLNVKVYNPIGQLINNDLYKSQVGNVKYEINLAGLPTGVYMVQVQMGNEVFNKKVMKF